MARLFLILFFLFSIHGFGQSILSDSSYTDLGNKMERSRRLLDSTTNPVKNARTLEEFLLVRFPKNSGEDGRWVYYNDHANIQRLIKPEISKVIPQYSIYKVRLTNYLGYHVNRCNNLVLFDSVARKIIHPQPTWYSDNNDEFINLFIGKQFSDSSALMAFVYELQDLLRIGSTGQFANTKYTIDTITFDDTFVGAHGTEVWRHIEIGIKNNTIIKYRSINLR
jgi:hypothetical protein